MKTREEALELLNEWVRSDSLRKHCLGVAACMEGYAKKKVEEEKLSAVESAAVIDRWWICGLLHDFDWEKYPNIDEHPMKGCDFLKSGGWDEEIVEAILGHNSRSGVARETKMAKTLFAVDELSGLVCALAKVRPGNFEGMSAKSVRKAMKKKMFAAAINRDEIRHGIGELGEGENEHFELVVGALRGVKKDLGFA